MASPTPVSPMTDEAADLPGPGDFSDITAGPTTRMVTTTFEPAGQPELQLPAYATTATQTVNEQHASLHAGCSSRDLRENTMNIGSRLSPTAESAHLQRNILLNGPGNGSAPTPNTPKPGHGFACLPVVPQRRRRHRIQSQAHGHLSTRSSEVPQSAGVRGKKAQVQ
ncbi:hypothetical protein MRX96_004686 [Rhipicephalus microplus]